MRVFLFVEKYLLAFKSPLQRERLGEGEIN